jgi:hypothetical protein
MNAIVMAYRELHPRSRAQADWRYLSTGSRTRAQCVYCRDIVATCSAAYPETKTFRRLADGHSRACAMAWARREFSPAVAAALIAVVDDADLRVHATIATAAVAVRSTISKSR